MLMFYLKYQLFKKSCESQILIMSMKVISFKIITRQIFKVSRFDTTEHSQKLRPLLWDLHKPQKLYWLTQVKCVHNVIVFYIKLKTRKDLKNKTEFIHLNRKLRGFVKLGPFCVHIKCKDDQKWRMDMRSNSKSPKQFYKKILVTSTKLNFFKGYVRKQPLR
jgi:hypothetical protein